MYKITQFPKYCIGNIKANIVWESREWVFAGLLHSTLKPRFI